MPQEHHDGTKRLFSMLFRFSKMGIAKAACEKLSPGEMTLMSVLNAYSGTLKKEILPICEIIQRLNTTQPAVTQLVNRLEAKGLVKRESDPNDKRTVLVRTTPQGTRLFKKEYEASLNMADAIIERMGDERADEFIALLGEFMTEAQALISERQEEETK